MRRRRRIKYLVSGAGDIYPSHAVLLKSGRHVRHDNDVDPSAARALRGASSFVVVAHGSDDGTVHWFRSDRGTSERWLWVGMKRPPKRARVHLYACWAGGKLVPFLTGCESFGHSDSVPMPIGRQRHVVLRFLDRADEALRRSRYEVEAWRKELGDYVNQELVKASRRAKIPLLTMGLLLILRRSLDYVD